MSQRIVVIAGAVIVIALVAFSVFRSTEKAAPPPVATLPSTPAPAVTQTQPAPTSSPIQMPPLASPRTAAAPPITTPPVLAEREPTKEEVVDVPRTKPEDVLQGFEAKNLTIIDVRDADSYKERHIPGALHIPLAYIAGEVPYLPKDKPIVTYCT